MSTNWTKGFILVVVCAALGQCQEIKEERAINATGLWSKYNLIVKPTVVSRVPETTPESRYSPVELEEPEESLEDESEDEDDSEDEGYEDFHSSTQRASPTHVKPKVKERRTKGHKKVKGLKKLKKYMLPLLLAYKLKFFTLIPLLLGGLVLIVATTGFAGFFFALFAVGVGLKKD